MTEWGKALRPSVHDLIKQTNALDTKIDDIETLPIVAIDYDTESVEISATINKTYEELRTYTQGCIVHDAYFNDVTLGTVTVDDDFVQLVYGFSGIVSEAVTYNTVTVTVNDNNTNEVVIGTDSFSGGSKFFVIEFSINWLNNQAIELITPIEDVIEAYNNSIPLIAAQTNLPYGGWSYYIAGWFPTTGSEIATWHTTNIQSFNRTITNTTFTLDNQGTITKSESSIVVPS